MFVSLLFSIDDTLQVKITDNALSRDLFPMDYHCLGDNENRPVRWMALESLVNNEFSSASDVVSARILEVSRMEKQLCFNMFFYFFKYSNCSLKFFIKKASVLSSQSSQFMDTSCDPNHGPLKSYFILTIALSGY